MVERIAGIGVDIVAVERIALLWHKFPQKFLTRILSGSELQEMKTDCGWDASRLAGRWAAKEAVAKALGSGFRGFGFKDIEISHDALGKPLVSLSGGAREAAYRQKITKVMLSISHEKDTAIAYAMAIAE